MEKDGLVQNGQRNWTEGLPSASKLTAGRTNGKAPVCPLGRRSYSDVILRENYEYTYEYDHKQQIFLSIL